MASQKFVRDPHVLSCTLRSLTNFFLALNQNSWFRKRSIVDLAQKCSVDRQAALQKLSNIFEAAENRKDSQVYREFEFSLPNELTEEQNIAWAKDFIHHTFSLVNVKEEKLPFGCNIRMASFLDEIFREFIEDPHKGLIPWEELIISEPSEETQENPSEENKENFILNVWSVILP